MSGWFGSLFPSPKSEVKPEGEVTDQDRLDALLRVWKQTIEVQQHFNDLEWRIRGLALTVVTVSLGAAGLAMQKDTRLALFGWDANASGVILLAAAFIWLAFFFVDRVWYHPLLMGAVKAAAKMESALREHVPEADLGGAISTESAVVVWRPIRFLFPLRPGDGGVKKLHSDQKLGLFYGLVAVVLFTLGIALMFSAPASQSEPPPARTPSAVASPSPTSGSMQTARPSAPSNSGPTRTATSRP